MSFINVSQPSEYVALVELARKPVNAFNPPLFEEFRQTFERLAEDGDVRVIVLCSALAKLFCGGLDLNETNVLSNNAPTDPSRKARVFRNHIHTLQDTISAIERCPQPVILATHGHCIGLGVDIASACDIRYAASDSVFSIREVEIGLAADVGTLARLPKSSGNQSLVRELTYTARNFTAQEAREIGFVSKVVEGSREEVIGAALDTAKVIAAKSPVAVTSSKRLLLHSRDHSVEDNLEYTATWNAAALQSADVAAAIKGVMSKKPTRFQPLPKLTARVKL